MQKIDLHGLYPSMYSPREPSGAKIVQKANDGSLFLRISYSVRGVGGAVVKPWQPCIMVAKASAMASVADNDTEDIIILSCEQML